MTAATAEHRPDLTVVSLFDGIGGFPLAFEQAGAVTVATVEIDADASAIGRRHFPDATQFDDVTKVTADDLRAVGFVPNRGVVTAGWPCQDFSVAGRRAGLAGSRSGLWWHVARILDELKPRWFFGENVPGLLSSVCQCPGDGTCIANGHGGRCAEKAHNVKPDGCCVGGCMATHGGAMGTVLGSLADLGYGFAYRVLDAQYFGVPQQRRRVWARQDTLRANAIAKGRADAVDKARADVNKQVAEAVERRMAVAAPDAAQLSDRLKAVETALGANLDGLNAAIAELAKAGA